ncbi:MAG TPA: GNAT family N-acetyltransferase [Caulobacteraceae bacterium]|jgi:ribosomal protein S18 acetylase RimI-like enzyme
MTQSYAKSTPPGTPDRPPLTIRRAGPADAEALVTVGRATFTQTFGHLYPPEDLAAFLAEAHGLARARADLADPAKAVWLAEAGGEVVGYAVAGPCHLPHPDVSQSCGELERIYLLRSHQGGGAGSRLLEEALAWLEQDGPRRLWIGVWSQNHGAQRLYERRGFEQVGAYEFVVGRTRDHELILRRD